METESIPEQNLEAGGIGLFFYKIMIGVMAIWAYFEFKRKFPLNVCGPLLILLQVIAAKDRSESELFGALLKFGYGEKRIRNTLCMLIKFDGVIERDGFYAIKNKNN